MDPTKELYKIDEEKFNKFIDYFNEKTESYKFKGYFFFAFIGSISVISLSNLINITYHDTNLTDAINAWIFGSVILATLVNFFRGNIIELFETKYS